MSYFLSTATIEKAYEELVSSDLKKEGAGSLFTFCILKGCQFDNLTSKPLSNIQNFGMDVVKGLGWLFSPNENAPNRNNFINPFRMSKWWGDSATEDIETWIENRFTNNIVGGGRKWRQILKYDANTELVKFSYNYIDEIKKILHGKKVNLLALVLWFNRYTKFEKKVSMGDLCKEFIDLFSLNNLEINSFFHSSNMIPLQYTNSIHNAVEIRKLIGKPSGISNWLTVPIVTTHLPQNNFMRSFSMETLTANNVDKDLLLKLLFNYNQIILSGPPGTSKSYIATEIMDQFQIIRKIQFHPQYSYQQFVGGYIVEGDQVMYKRGLLLNYLKDIKEKEDAEAQNPPETPNKYLLIIDEINRANLSQVFGELIQCLDRDYATEVLVNGNPELINLPKNLYIIGTMNSTDRTLGAVDYALRRRFLNIYCPPNPELLIDLCPVEDDISVYDFLKKINDNLINTLKNRDLVIGHAVFFAEHVKNPEDNKFYWKAEDFEILFNYKILPIIEEYCYGNSAQVRAVIGDKLPNRLQNEEFIAALKEFINP